ncbi:hypothetical protein XBO1_2620001 [Xenorhabdus bovienii str. oregonense]|uniref:Tail fiber protein n=2 Tax=Xenorhabdus bovienii TaxID=40576 RepID=A0A077NYK8_XENBV|nr:hypothetical protein XBO1_2620001 [Xenorhabdus bovienii str. oregonense]
MSQRAVSDAIQTVSDEVRHVDGQIKSVNREINTVRDSVIANASIGINQQFLNHTDGRKIGVAYRNETGRPIWVMVSVSMTGESSNHLRVNNAIVSMMGSHFTAGAFKTFTHTAIVPAGYEYSLVSEGGQNDIFLWLEMR